MKNPILILGIIVAMLGMGNSTKAQQDSTIATLCCSNDTTVVNKWFIQATTEYHRPFWSKDFRNFMDQHVANIYDLSGVNSIGWTVGMPIPSTDDFKIIADYSTTMGTNLKVQTGDVSVRYNIINNVENSIFSIDLGGGMHMYTFEYHDPMISDDLVMGDLDDMLTYQPNAFDITQRLWNLHVGLNCELQFSRKIVAFMGIRYRILMDGKTTLDAFHRTIDAFPQITHHILGFQIGLTYYFDRL